jgi:conjugative relaxase-like TrwC/TraI family protein
MKIPGQLSAVINTLGLSGIVERDTFENILNGMLPDGEKVGQVENRKLGTDLTFSMPKSASIMMLVAGDTRIAEAQLGAVKAAVKFAERELAESRTYEKNPKGEPQKTGNLVAALFAHDTSRALDPQGHIHAIIANLTQDKDGTWKALHNGEIWRNNTVLGQVYHAALRGALQKLGYETEAVGKHGSFEIKGVPKDLRDEFSKRSKDIDAKAKELDIRTPQGRDKVVINTRDDKVNVEDKAALVESWKERAAALGFDGKALHQEALDRTSRGGRSIGESMVGVVQHISERVGKLFSAHNPMVSSPAAQFFMSGDAIKAEHAVASAVRHLSEREAAFEKYDIIRSALGFQIKGLEVERVEQRIGELIGKGQLIPGKSEREDGHYLLVTTPEALKREQAILDGIDAGKAKGMQIIAPSEVVERISAQTSERPLNEGQMAAAVMILSSENRINLVQGVAGAGKSTMINAVARVAEAEGKEVLGLAFQNKMVADLKGGASLSVDDMKKEGINAQTIASFVNKHHGPAMVGQGPRFEATRDALNDSILIVDESSMVSSKDMLKLVQTSHALGINLVFIGDRQQLSAIEQGKSFAVAQAHGAPMARMDDNLRQAGSPLLLAVAGLTNEGFASQAIGLLDAHGKVSEGGKDYIEKAAQAWLDRSPEHRERTAIFTAGRDDRAAVNNYVQKGLQAEGTVKGEGLAIQALQSANLTREQHRFESSYREGMVLEARIGVKEISLKKGEYQVIGTDGKGRVILERDGVKKVFKPQNIDPSHRFDRLTLHEGDKVRWTERDKERDIAKSGMATILGITDKGVTVELDDKRQMTLKADDPMLRRMDLGYALNAHMAQGVTKDEAIQTISAYQKNLASQRAENVLATRAMNDLHVFTDNKEDLQKQLDRTPGNKTSALETVGALDVDPKRSITPVQLPPIGLSDELLAKLSAVPTPDHTNTLPVPEKKISLDLA